MAEQKQNQPEGEVKKDKYKQLKEELGYSDEDIRALSKSIKLKVIAVVSPKRKRKLDYLIQKLNHG